MEGMKNIKNHLKHILLSNRCTKCGKKQEAGEIFTDYGRDYLCEQCERKKEWRDEHESKTKRIE